MNTAALPDHGCKQYFELVQELGDCYAQIGDYQQARNCYKQAAALDANEAGPYIGTGMIFLRQGQMFMAEQSFDTALSVDPCSSRALAGKAMTAHAQGYLHQACDLYIKSLEIDPDNWSVLAALLDLSEQAEMSVQADKYLDLYLDMHPGDTRAMLCMARLYQKDNNSTLTRKILRDILVFEPDNSEALCLLNEVQYA